MISAAELGAAVDLSDGRSFAAGFPHAFFTELRARGTPYRHAPTAATPDGEGFWVVSRYADVSAVVRDAATFSSDRAGGRAGGGTELKDSAVAGKVLNQTDDPHHRRLRELVQKGFTARSTVRLEAELRERTIEILDGYIAGGATDFVPAVARELPLQAICTILGVPLADRARLVEWVDAGIENDTGDVIAHDYLRRLGEYALGLIAAKRAAPAEDILSLIVHARLEGYEPPQLSDRELKLFFNLLFPAGAETTRSALAGAVLAFIDFPDEYRRLRADRSLVPTAVEEIVRWTTPSIYKRRTAACDVDFRGAPIRAGEKVTVWEMSANRDEREFDEPFRFDVGRVRNRHMGFGAGVHFCLGSQLARLEIRLLLEALAERVEGFELLGEPRWTPNNRLLGLKSLPLRCVPA